MQLHRFLIPILLLICGSAAAQSVDSLIVQWKVSAIRQSEKTYELQVHGTVKNGWYLYAQRQPAEEVDGVRLETNDSALLWKSPVLQMHPQVIADAVFEGRKTEVVQDTLLYRQEVTFPTTVPAVLQAKLTYFVANGTTLLPEEQTIPVHFSGGITASPKFQILVPSIDIDHAISDCTSSTTIVKTEGKSLWSIFALGFIAGLIALLTPCVFPMIPLTVSFFTKKAASRAQGIRNALLYGFFIFLIYVVLSLPFYFLDQISPEILNNISTNVYLNLAFFIIFVVFAISFFGYFELTLPGAISNAADSKANTTRLAGIFFMALTLAIVSFSCTGPILGSLLASSLSADGGAQQLTAGMAGFGLALALPFALFALFPGMLQKLPRSGGWLNTVKVVLGFAELALALKFFSNADLVMHWGLLKREIFIGIWVLISLFASLYLFGFIRFPHDHAGDKISGARRGVAFLFAAFTLYLIPGVTNTSYANLKLISGFPPPLYYSIYKTDECILGLNCTHDYQTGLEMARETGKPMLIDFTGYGCVNCRRMEEKVWSQPDVLKLMKEHFIVVSLYVDDKKVLPASQQFMYTTKEGQQKQIRTVGDLWATFETENFKNNAQPLYAIIGGNQQLLNRPVGYTPDAAEYLRWLQCGLGTHQANR